MELGILSQLICDTDVLPHRRFCFSGRPMCVITDIAHETTGRTMLNDKDCYARFSWKNLPERLKTDTGMLKYYKKYDLQPGDPWYPIYFEYDECDGDLRMYGTQNAKVASSVLEKLDTSEVNPKYKKGVEREFRSRETPNKVIIVKIDYTRKMGRYLTVNSDSMKVHGIDTRNAIEAAMHDGYGIGTAMRVYDSDYDDDDCINGEDDSYYHAVFMFKEV